MENDRDKIYHFLAYFLIGNWLVGDNLKPKNWWNYIIVWGILTEGIQYFLPYRSFSFMDIFANASGVVLGMKLVQLKYFPSFTKIILQQFAKF